MQCRQLGMKDTLCCQLFVGLPSRLRVEIVIGFIDRTVLHRIHGQIGGGKDGVVKNLSGLKPGLTNSALEDW